MRMEEWEPDMVAFARDAAVYTGYYGRLAEAVRAVAVAAGAPGDGETLCDAGCGLGYLGVALAREYGRIDLVDRAPRAIAFAGRLAQAAGARNIRAQLADAFGPRRPRSAYDCMVFCTCCSPARALAAGLAQCRGTVVVVNRVDDPGARGPAADGGSRRPPAPRPELARRVTEAGVATTEGALRILDVPFVSRMVELEFGQPFETLAGARRWFALYRNRDYPAGPTDAQLLEHLVPAAGRWRYYLPKRRRLSLFAFRVADVARVLERRPQEARACLGLDAAGEAPCRPVPPRAARAPFAAHAEEVRP